MKWSNFVHFMIYGVQEQSPDAWVSVGEDGPCTYRHFNFPSQMENEKWKMDTHFPFSIYDEKWKLKNGRPISFSIFHRKWKMENGYPFSIFHFAFAMESTKWATEKSTKTTTHILVLWHNYCWNRYLLLLSAPNKFGQIFWEEEWSVVATPSTWNIGSTGPIGAKSLILNRYSLVAPQP